MTCPSLLPAVVVFKMFNATRRELAKAQGEDELLKENLKNNGITN